jgi:membrane glycosyltransferase
MRRMLFLCVFLMVSGTGIVLFADYLWRTQLYGLKYAILVLYSILFCLIAFLFCNAFFGFIELHRPGRRVAISADEAPEPDGELPPTCVLFPIHNEDVNRTMAGVKAIWQSVRRTGRSEAFDFFILSDSTRPDYWVREEIAWFHVAKELDAFDHLHYRHRPDNSGMKSGNISHFLEQWGRRYKYMVILDADSLMTGQTLLRLVQLMEAHSNVGIIQTTPLLVRGETLYARLQQFASWLYSRVYAAGMSFWQGSEGNYIGHNAIVRVKPFMENCRLPRLPWKEPMGGHIYSHDFVEAALIRKGGYEVWLAYDLGGSYEEGPPNLVAGAWRHRRWCQGNLQHLWLLFSNELPLISRCHFLLGILAYTSSLFWFLWLLFSTLVVIQFERSGLSLIPSSGFTRFLRLSLTQHSVVLFALAFGLLLSPKLFGLLDLCLDRRRLRAWGGFWRCTANVVMETLLSVFMAPVFMLWYTLFVVTIPMGKGVKWIAQSRDPRQGLSWRLACRTHAWLTLIGVCWMAVDYSTNRDFFRWMLLINGPLIMSIPLNMLLSSLTAGAWLKRHGFLLTPPEREPGPELETLDESEQSLTAYLDKLPQSTATLALTDPYVNALHVVIQRQTGAATPMPGVNLDGDGLADFKNDPARLFQLLLDDKACLAVHRHFWDNPDESMFEKEDLQPAGHPRPVCMHSLFGRDGAD